MFGAAAFGWVPPAGAYPVTTNTTPTDADTGAGTESGTIAASLTGADTAAGAEAGTLAATLTAAESHVGFARFPGGSGNYASAADIGALSDMSVVALSSATDWTPASSNRGWMSHLTSASRAWGFRLVATSGLLRLVLSLDGTSSTAYDSTVAPTVSDGQQLWTMVTRNSTTGDIKFYTAPYTGLLAPPAIGLFTQLGATVAGPTGALFNSTTIVEVGSDNGGTGLQWNGDIHRVTAYSGVYGSGSETIVRDFYPTDAANTSATSWIATTSGETWTLNGTVSLFAWAAVDTQVSIGVTAAVTDSAAGTETGSLAVTLTGTDTAAGTEAASTIRLSNDDAGSGAETGTYGAALTANDTASGSESQSVVAQTDTPSDGDTGTGVDGGESIVVITTTQGGHGRPANAREDALRQEYRARLIREDDELLLLV